MLRPRMEVKLHALVVFGRPKHVAAHQRLESVSALVFIEIDLRGMTVHFYGSVKLIEIRFRKVVISPIVSFIIVLLLAKRDQIYWALVWKPAV